MFSVKKSCSFRPEMLSLSTVNIWAWVVPCLEQGGAPVYCGAFSMPPASACYMPGHPFPADIARCLLGPGSGHE